jgi:hypothetical protein
MRMAGVLVFDSASHGLLSANESSLRPSHAFPRIRAKKHTGGRSIGGTRPRLVSPAKGGSGFFVMILDDAGMGADNEFSPLRQVVDKPLRQHFASLLSMA